MKLNTSDLSAFFAPGLTERQILEVFQLLAESGSFNLRDNLGDFLTIYGLNWALNNKYYELYRFLWGTIDLLNVWTYDVFQVVSLTCAQDH